MLGTHPPPDDEDMRRDCLRVQLNVVAHPVPDIARLGQKVVCLVRLAWVKSQILQRKGNETGLFVMRVEINHYQHLIRAIYIAFGISNDLLVIHFVEAQVVVGMECRVGVADLVYFTNQFSQAVRSLRYPSF